ncbi:FAD-binding oxidoreductase [Candidatus Accumulibacter aalborgensis]|uniref:FAD-binding oxidoreductase n=1 Tax=Candidatus Accumulibacter aalborgensis TaxID=1860102 RepID=UPI001647A075
MPLSGWGRLPISRQTLLHCRDRSSPLPLPDHGTLLPYGNGRSYGDVPLNDGGYALLTRGLDRFIAFDATTGLLRAEAGVTLDEVLKLIVQQGWFLTVTPGTRFVTLGGCLANDVHGKNHHVAGCFSAHVTRFELLRSDGERRICFPNDPWFRATAGGLGLTGLITWLEIHLQPIANAWITLENRAFRNLEEYFQINHAREAVWPYTVAWIDCAARGSALGRGVYMAGRHAPVGTNPPPIRHSQWTLPFTPPFSLVNTPVLRTFNWLYYHAPRPRLGYSHYAPFFFPLDHVRNWNRIYGPRGFYQYQFLVPHKSAWAALCEVLDRIACSGQGSFLAVLKSFGNLPAQGMLSFPRPGVTLALDFPNRGAKTSRLLDALDDVIRQAGGALYPAKDSRMRGDDFQRAYPEWQEFRSYIDPRFSSDFWRRVTEQG